MLRQQTDPADATQIFAVFDETVQSRDVDEVNDMRFAVFPFLKHEIPEEVSDETRQCLQIWRTQVDPPSTEEWSERVLRAASSENQVLSAFAYSLLPAQPNDALAAHLIDVLNRGRTDNPAHFPAMLYIQRSVDPRFGQVVWERLQTTQSPRDWARSAERQGFDRHEVWKLLVNRLGSDKGNGNILQFFVNHFAKRGGGGPRIPLDEVRQLKVVWSTFIDDNADEIRDGSLFEGELLELPSEMIPSTFHLR